MEYLFDMFLNWQSNGELYDFFEWSTDDEIEIIKIIPLVKISKNDYFNVMHGKVKFNKEFLNSIYKKTKVQSSGMIKTLDYNVVFTEGDDAFAVELDENGEVVLRSSMQLEDVQEATKKVLQLNNNVLEVVEPGGNKKSIFNSRKEREIINFLLCEIDRIYLSNNVEQLRYLYNDVFSHDKINMLEIYNDLKTCIEDKWTDEHDKLYELIQLMSTTK